MPKRTGRKLVGGVVVMCGIGCGAVAMAAPASAPGFGTVRAESQGDPVVVDLDGLDAAVAAARLESTTTTAAVAPPSTGATTTTSTVAPPVTAAAARTRAAAPASTTTSTTTTTAPPPASPAEAAIAHWFPDVYDEAVEVASCESSMDPGAVSSGGGNHGLFQINEIHESEFEAVTGRPWSDIYDPDANAEFARHLYDKSGWSPWACSP